PRPRGGFLQRLFCPLHRVFGDEDPGLCEVDRHRVGGVAEHLHLDVVGGQHRRHQVRLQALALEHDLPALDGHPPHPREGSTVAGCRAPKWPAAAIIAALSVQSSSGGMVRRARSPTTSAARLRSSVLAATPPATTTSLLGTWVSAASSFSSSDSTTDSSKAAPRSARVCSSASPRSRSLYSSAVLRPLKLYSRPGSDGRGRRCRRASPVRASRSSAGPPG